jgi:hypothetical protein
MIRRARRRRRLDCLTAMPRRRTSLPRRTAPAFGEKCRNLWAISNANAQDVSWRLEGWRLRSIAFGYSRWIGGDYQFSRTPERIARDGLDMIRLMRCVEGAVWWRVEEREFAQRPGDIVVTDFSRPDQMRAATRLASY